MAGKTTDDVTLLRGKRAGNFTNIGDVGDFEMCIKRCCQSQKCDLAFKSSETCFLVSCFSKESCQTSPSLDDIFSPRMCFVTRHSRDEEKGNQVSIHQIQHVFCRFCFPSLLFTYKCNFMCVAFKFCLVH